jgi:hypothetical protein
VAEVAKRDGKVVVDMGGSVAIARNLGIVPGQLPEKRPRLAVRGLGLDRPVRLAGSDRPGTNWRGLSAAWKGALHLLPVSMERSDALYRNIAKTNFQVYRDESSGLAP